MRRQTAVLAVLLLSCLALAACGGDDDAGPASTPAAQGTEAPDEAPAEEATEEPAGGGEATEVAIKDFTFSPDPVEVKVGDTVKWTNEDAAPHTATADGEFDSKNMGQGGTFEYTAAKAGTFKYICTIHPSMKGTLEVAE